MAASPDPARLYPDADLAHPWVARWRIPLIDAPEPAVNYEVAVVRPTPFMTSLGERAEWDALLPSEDEAQLVGALIGYRVAMRFGPQRRRSFAGLFDVNPTGTPIVLLKSASRGWRYRRPGLTGAGLLVPGAGEIRYPGNELGLWWLINDRIFGWGGDAWADFTEANAERFPARARSAAILALR